MFRHPGDTAYWPGISDKEREHRLHALVYELGDKLQFWQGWAIAGWLMAAYVYFF